MPYISIYLVWLHTHMERVGVACSKDNALGLYKYIHIYSLNTHTHTLTLSYPYTQKITGNNSFL